MAWLRLDALTFQDRNVRRAGRAGRLVFLAAITMTKAHLWVNSKEERGFLPEKDFNAEEIAVWFGEGGDTASVLFYQTGLDACLKEGLIVPDDDGFIVPNWTKYQVDPTNAARQAELRARRRDAAHLRPLSEPENGRKTVDSRGVTVDGAVAPRSNGDNRDKPRQPRSPTGKFHGVTVTTVSNDDGTGRDVTKSTSPSPSTPTVPPAPVPGAAPAAQGPAAPSASARPNGIAVRGEYRPGELGNPANIPNPAERIRELQAQLARSTAVPSDGLTIEQRRGKILAELGEHADEQNS